MKFCHLFLFQITASENSSMSIFTFFNRNFEIHFLRDLLAFFSCFSWVAFICCVRFAFITAFSHWFLQFCWNFLLLASFLGFQSAKLFFHFAILFHFLNFRETPCVALLRTLKTFFLVSHLTLFFRFG